MGVMIIPNKVICGWLGEIPLVVQMMDSYSNTWKVDGEARLVGH